MLTTGRLSSVIEPLEQRRLMAFADLVPSWGDKGVGPDVTVAFEQADGKVLAFDNGGSSSPSHLYRLNADGSPDTGFSSDGKITWATPIVAARQLDNGQIAIAYAYRRNNEQYNDKDDVIGYGVARFNRTGGLDTSFGQGGNNSATFKVTKVGQYVDVADVAITNDGATYLAATGHSLYLRTGGDQGFSSFVVKFDATGQLDNRFGTNGVVTLPRTLETSLRSGVARGIDTIALRDNDTLLIAGTEFATKTVRNKQYRYDETKFVGLSAYVTRLRADGTFDSGFGNGGTFSVGKEVPVDGVSSDGESAKLIRQPDGRLLLVTRAQGGVKILTLTAGGQAIKALNTPPADAVAGTGDLESVALLKNGNVAFTRQGVLFEARKTAGGYVVQAPRIPVDTTGEPISTDYGLGNLLALRDGDFLLGRYGATFKISPGDGRAPRADDIGGAGPFSISTTVAADYHYDFVPIDPLDAYYHDAAGGLKYRHRDAAGQWGAAETVDPSADAGTFVDGLRTSVVYVDGSTADLMFATRRKNGVWKRETIDSAGATGFYCNVVRPDADTLVVAYYDRTKGDLRLARRGADGVWKRQTIDSAGDVGRYAKLAIRPDGGLSIAYATNGGAGVRLAEQPAGGGAWAFTNLTAGTVAVGGLDVGYFSTYIDQEDTEPEMIRTTVAFYDADRSDLFVAYRPDTGRKFTLLHDKQKGVAGLDPHVLSGAGEVSFYDRGRNSVRTAYVLDDDTKATLVADAVPLVPRAGPMSAPVTRYTVPGLYLKTVARDYAADYAWVDATRDVLEIRSRV